MQEHICYPQSSPTRCQTLMIFPEYPIFLMEIISIFSAKIGVSQLAQVSQTAPGSVERWPVWEEMLVRQENCRKPCPFGHHPLQEAPSVVPWNRHREDLHVGLQLWTSTSGRPLSGPLPASQHSQRKQLTSLPFHPGMWAVLTRASHSVPESRIYPGNQGSTGSASSLNPLPTLHTAFPSARSQDTGPSVHVFTWAPGRDWGQPSSLVLREGWEVAMDARLFWANHMQCSGHRTTSALPVEDQGPPTVLLSAAGSLPYQPVCPKLYHHPHWTILVLGPLCCLISLAVLFTLLQCS